MLVEQPGGTETFYRLHALLSDGRETRDVSTRLLGDRIEVRTLRIDDGVIEADLLVQQPGQFITVRPSVPITTEFVLTNRGLLPAASPASGESAPSESPRDSTYALTAGVWTIVSIRAREAPAMAANSTGDPPQLSFVEELRDVDGSSGRLFGSTCCNRLLGSYQATNAGGIKFSGIAITRRACEPARTDFEQRLIMSLGSALGFEVRTDELEIRFAGGVVSLSRAPESDSPPETS